MDFMVVMMQIDDNGAFPNLFAHTKTQTHKDTKTHICGFVCLCFCVPKNTRISSNTILVLQQPHVLVRSPSNNHTSRSFSNHARRCPRAMKFFWFYFLLCEIERRERENNSDTEHQHSRYQKRFHRSLSVEERRLRQQKIPRESLHFIHESSWRRLFYSYNNQSLITLTGLDHGTFDYLLRKFQPIFESRTPFGLNGDGYGDGLLFGSRKGRKRKVTAMDCLGIVLAWTRTRGSTYSLQMHFGLTMSNLSIYLRFGRRIIVEVLQDDEYAKIAIPSEEKIRQYSHAIKSLYPCLDDVWASMDGLKTLIQKAGSTQQQAYFYNGWKHNHFVTSVFCFCPDGTIPIAFMNLPGATHDSTIADLGGIYSKLESVFMA